MTFAQMFLEIMNQVGTNGRRKQRERGQGMENTKRTPGRKWDPSVLKDVFEESRYQGNSSFFLGCQEAHPPHPRDTMSPGLLACICIPRFMLHANKTEASPLDCPLSALAWWFLVGFGQREALVRGWKEREVRAALPNFSPCGSRYDWTPLWQLPAHRPS